MSSSLIVDNNQSTSIPSTVQPQPKQDKYAKWEIKWNCKNLWNKESKAQGALGYFAQTTMYKVGAIVVGLLDSIQNLLRFIGNRFISLANATNRLFSKEQTVAESGVNKQTPPEEAVVKNDTPSEEAVNPPLESVRPERNNFCEAIMRCFRRVS